MVFAKGVRRRPVSPQTALMDAMSQLEDRMGERVKQVQMRLDDEIKAVRRSLR